MANESKTTWHSAKNPPKDYCHYLCVLRMNDQGDYAKWQSVLSYDFKKKIWCEGSADYSEPHLRKEITDWWSVICWKPLEWPENLNDF